MRGVLPLVFIVFIAVSCRPGYDVVVFGSTPAGIAASRADAIPDFSRVGYHYGDDSVPDVPVVKVLTAPKGNQDVAYGCGIVVRRV